MPRQPAHPLRLTQAADLILAAEERKRWGSPVPAEQAAKFTGDELVEAFEFLRRLGLIDQEPTPWTGPSSRP